MSHPGVCLRAALPMMVFLGCGSVASGALPQTTAATMVEARGVSSQAERPSQRRVYRPVLIGVVRLKRTVLRLWTIENAGTQCWFVETGEKPPSTQMTAGGTCEQSPPPHSRFQWAWSWSAASPSANILVGRVYAPAASVRVSLSNGNVRMVSVNDHLFFAAFPRSTHLDRLVGYDRHGHRVT
jgi:hypothetical protein